MPLQPQHFPVKPREMTDRWNQRIPHVSMAAFPSARWSMQGVQFPDVVNLVRSVSIPQVWQHIARSSFSMTPQLYRHVLLRTQPCVGYAALWYEAIALTHTLVWQTCLSFWEGHMSNYHIRSVQLGVFAHTHIGPRISQAVTRGTGLIPGQGSTDLKWSLEEQSPYSCCGILLEHQGAAEWTESKELL